MALLIREDSGMFDHKIDEIFTKQQQQTRRKRRESGLKIQMHRRWRRRSFKLQSINTKAVLLFSLTCIVLYVVLINYRRSIVEAIERTEVESHRRDHFSKEHQHQIHRRLLVKRSHLTGDHHNHNHNHYHHHHPDQRNSQNFNEHHQLDHPTMRHQNHLHHQQQQQQQQKQQEDDEQSTIDRGSHQESFRRQRLRRRREDKRFNVRENQQPFASADQISYETKRTRGVVNDDDDGDDDDLVQVEPNQVPSVIEFSSHLHHKNQNLNLNQHQQHNQQQKHEAEQLPIVVSTSDNSYVSASPIEHQKQVVAVDNVDSSSGGGDDDDDDNDNETGDEDSNEVDLGDSESTTMMSSSSSQSPFMVKNEREEGELGVESSNSNNDFNSRKQTRARGFGGVFSGSPLQTPMQTMQDESRLSASYAIIATNDHRIPTSSEISTTATTTSFNSNGEDVEVDLNEDADADDDSSSMMNHNLELGGEGGEVDFLGQNEPRVESNVTSDLINHEDPLSRSIESGYTTHSATIIKTRESIRMGASFLNYTIVTNLNACLVECVITDSCDTAIYQETPVDFVNNNHLPSQLHSYANQRTRLHNNVIYRHRNQQHYNQQLKRQQNHNQLNDLMSSSPAQANSNYNNDAADGINVNEQGDEDPSVENRQHSRFINNYIGLTASEFGGGGGLFLCYLFQCSKLDGFKCQFSSHTNYISSTRRKEQLAQSNNQRRHLYLLDPIASDLEQSMSGNSVSVVEAGKQVVGQPNHYSKIITSPSNHHKIDGRPQFHDARLGGSISIGQELEAEFDYHQGGNLNSALIAILIGIGATGMLIIIVSHKMQSIRQRLAYKSRRRSLVPDADFLINTIPIDSTQFINQQAYNENNSNSNNTLSSSCSRSSCLGSGSLADKLTPSTSTSIRSFTCRSSSSSIPYDS